MANRQNLLHAAGLLLRRLNDLTHQADRPGADLEKVREEAAKVRETWKVLMQRVRPEWPADSDAA